MVCVFDGNDGGGVVTGDGAGAGDCEACTPFGLAIPFPHLRFVLGA